MRTFKVAGVSKLDGVMKFRVANDMTRVKVLAKNGHTGIDLIELKDPMTKEDAVAFLLSIDFATRDGVTNQEVQDALLAEVDKRGEKVKVEKAPKEPKPKAERKPKEAKPTMEGIEAKVAAKKKAVPKTTLTREAIEKQLADSEDAPF